jgi:hypothetical protein
MDIVELTGGQPDAIGAAALADSASVAVMVAA